MPTGGSFQLSQPSSEIAPVSIGTSLVLAEPRISPELDTLIRAATSDATRRAYQCDLQQFLLWGGSVPTTPNILAEYIVQHAPTLSIATLARRLVALGKAHTSLGLENPAASELVRRAMRGLRRVYGKPQRQATAAVRSDIVAMCSGLGDRIKDVRDRALLLVGFAGAFRRSELVGLNVADIEWVVQGIIILLRRSKTDQNGEGRKVAIPFGRGTVCPVLALSNWLARSAIIEGPIFRPIDRHGRIEQSALTGDAVACIVKQRAGAAGCDPTHYSGHSLRAGLATSAAAAGVSAWKIRAQTGHKSDAMLSRYVRDGMLFNENAAGAVL